MLQTVTSREILGKNDVSQCSTNFLNLTVLGNREHSSRSPVEVRRLKVEDTATICARNIKKRREGEEKRRKYDRSSETDYSGVQRSIPPED